jgi:hypothetical protein
MAAVTDTPAASQAAIQALRKHEAAEVAQAEAAKGALKRMPSRPHAPRALKELMLLHSETKRKSPTAAPKRNATTLA